MLHVHALSESERAQAGAQDPVVREMLDRALALAPEDILGLHSHLEDSGDG